MKKIYSLLATALMLLMVGCAGPVLAQTYMENPKFLRITEPVLGLNVTELRTVLGNPIRIEPAACYVPLEVEGKRQPTPIPGIAWVYENHASDEMAAVMVVCVINNHAVGEQRHMALKEGNRILEYQQTLVDLDLIKKAYNGELDDTSHEERTVPQYDGPKYDI